MDEDRGKKFKEGYDWADLGQLVEKKGEFSYLSWPHGVAQLLQRYPYALWEYTWFDGRPYAWSDAGCFVEVRLWLDAQDKGQPLIHPILDYRHKPIANPTSFEVNTALMRCLSKLISIRTGIGLRLYAGEDLPDISAAPPANERPATPRQAAGTGAATTPSDDLQEEITSAFMNCQYVEPNDRDDDWIVINSPDLLVTLKKYEAAHEKGHPLGDDVRQALKDYQIHRSHSLLKTAAQLIFAWRCLKVTAGRYKEQAEKEGWLPWLLAEYAKREKQLPKHGGNDGD